MSRQHTKSPSVKYARTGKRKLHDFSYSATATAMSVCLALSGYTLLSVLSHV
jgi:hypothetical protein